jgi:hypothetical protein
MPAEKTFAQIAIDASSRCIVPKHIERKMAEASSARNCGGCVVNWPAPTASGISSRQAPK